MCDFVCFLAAALHAAMTTIVCARSAFLSFVSDVLAGRRSPPRYSRDYPPRDYDRDRDYGRDRERDYGRDRERDYGYPPRESRDYYRGPPPPAEYRSERDRYPPAPSSYDRDRRY